ncbi:MAG: adaptor protein MecA [Alicyclobacillus sp.]|nr:adaptor protein MecA [Alicyclobacillus sp.]
MRVERIAKDKVRIFISYDDLAERGIDKDEIWQNGKKVQELFWDMMETAYEEVGFEIVGPIAVEAFTMPTEGVVVIVTRVPSLPGRVQDREDDEESTAGEEEVETEVSYDSTFVFRFRDFEEVVRAAHALNTYSIRAILYYFRDAYHLFLDENSMSEQDYDAIWAICHEYGEYCAVTPAVLEEYGRPIFTHNTLSTLVRRFPLQ